MTERSLVAGFRDGTRRGVPVGIAAAGVLVILFVAALPIGADSGRSPLRPPAAGHPVDPLSAAAASLAAGKGPARGQSLTCPGAGATRSCSAADAPAAPLSSPPARWLQLSKSLSNAPPPRFVASMTYDAADHEVVLFGGANSTITFGDTWTYADGRWTDLSGTLSSAPSPREIAAMTYDAQDGYVLLFGGFPVAIFTTGTIPLPYNDTWKFTQGKWMQLNPPSAPSVRYRAAMSYDAADGYVVLFGGTGDANATPKIYNDTWKFTAGGWTNITKLVKGSPPGRFRTMMVYDPVDRYCVLYGGSTTSTSFADNATWTYVKLNWTKLTGVTPPSVRAYYSFVWDAAQGYGLLFGGNSYGTAPAYYHDTWKFLNGAWTNLSGGFTTYPGSRWGAMVAFDGWDNYTVLLGGSSTGTSGTVILNDTWSYGPSVVSWTRATRTHFDLHQNTSLVVTAVAASGTVALNFTGLPPGCSNQNLSPLPCHPTQTGAYRVEAWANSSTGGGSTSNVTLAIVPDPTVASYDALPAAVTNGTSFHLVANVTNGSGSNAYRYAGLPNGCPSANTSNLSCTPRQTGRFTVEVTATDAAGYPAFSNTTVIVNPKPQVNAFVASPTTVDVHLNVSFQTTATGGTGPLTYNYSGLPPNCGAPTTSQFTCAPAAPGFYNVHVNVSDAFGWVDHKNVTVIVNPDPSLLSSAVEPVVIDQGASVTFWANATGGTGTLTTTFASAPPGCSPASGSPFTCVPTAPGTYTIRATVRDQLGVVATNDLTLLVNAQPMITDFSATPTTVDVGQAVHLAVSLSGGTAPFTFIYTGLPAGCTQSHNATLACTVGNPAGQFSVGVTVHDAFGNPQTSSLALLVNADPRVSSVSAVPNPATLGNRVTITVTVTGGTGPFTYTYTDLPDGCVTQNNSGLSCVPRTAGNFTFNASVTDALGVRATGSGNVLVQPTNSGSSTYSALGGSTPYLLAAGAILLAVVIGVVLVLRRRRTSSSPASQEPEELPPAEDAPPEYYEGPPQ